MSGDLGAFAAAALGIALSPLPFLLAVALLGTGRPIWNAGAFVSGEALAVLAIAAVAVLLTADGDAFAGALGGLEIAVGAVLAVLLLVHLRSPRLAGEVPRWSTLLARVGPRAAFAGGLAMIAVNPKNLALTLAGATAIVQLEFSAPGQAAGVVTFAVVAVSTLLALVALAAAFPERSSAALERAESFVVRRERVLVGGLLAALAALFLVRGLVATLS